MEEIRRSMKEIKEKVDEIYIDLCQRVNEIDGCINDLEDKIVNLELEETEDTANDGWIPKIYNGYYYIDLDALEVASGNWANSGYDNIRLNHKVIFKTESKAVEYLEYLEEKEKHMNTFTEEKWEDEKIKKWYYEYDCEDKKISYDYGNLLKKNIPYFKTKEETIDFTKKYKWQIKHELGVK